MASILPHGSTLLFECVAGSKAYGLASSASDTDIRGVFAVSASQFLGMSTVEQINADNNNTVYFELGRFVELLAKNNPNALELLGIREEFVRVRHPLFSLLTPELFLSKRCFDTFVRYASTQIKKAQNLNKKVFNPIQGERKRVLDFCYALRGYGSQPLETWLAERSWNTSQCGLVRVPHFCDVYALFYDHSGELSFRGITAKETSDEVATSAIPDAMQPAGFMTFNRAAYGRHCREYASYQQWLQERNEERYQNTAEHARGYDTKNMMHTFRLLSMAEDIAQKGTIVTQRPDRSELLAIRKGTYSYEELLVRAEHTVEHLRSLFAASALPEAPNEQAIEHVLVSLRSSLYGLSL